METIELWTGDEWVLVELLSKNSGVLQEASINSEYGYQDLVLLDLETNEITQVIKKYTNTVFLSYDIPFGGVDSLWEIIKIHFEKNKLHVKKHVDGIFLLSAPINFDKDDLKIIINKSPIKLVEVVQEENFDDDFDDEGDDLFHLN